MLDARSLILKYRSKGVLIDTNLLVLLLVGTVNKQRIPKFKRTAAFEIEDYELLVRLIEWFGQVLATPHVLAQVSDLTDLYGNELDAVRILFKNLVRQIEERFDASPIVVDDPLFMRLGLTDAAIATVCAQGNLVLTADLPLQVALQERGFDALNFNHIRAISW